MTYLESIFLGLVQGVAEFLPISSSGHLSLFQAFLGIESAEHASTFFDVLLHLGTLIAVFVAYWGDIVDMVKEFFAFLRDVAHGGSKQPVPPSRRMILLIILGTLPLFLVLPIKDAVDSLYDNTYFISFALLLTGTLLFLSDRVKRGHKDASTSKLSDALLVGCAQALATVPGLSRSGTTIAAGRFLGYDRKYAVRYSFLMSIPAVLGANILSLKEALDVGIEYNMVPIYLAGVVVAAVSGYFSIRLLNMLTDKGKFGAFAYYCWLAGALALVLSVIWG